MRILVLLTVLFCALLLTFTPAQPPVERADTPVRPIESGSFQLTVGKHYEMYVADRQQWPGNDTLLLVLKTYPNGWADVRTSEDQVASINMNQIVRVYRIDDVEKWKRMRGK